MSNLGLVLASGFGIGILGSFHCIGMCGPLALALPMENGKNKALSVILYNLGRCISYALIGIFFGLLGKSFSLFHLQQWLSIAAGLIILLVLLLQQYGKYSVPVVGALSHALKSKLGQYLRSEKSITSYLIIGLLNGLLPCGLVYVAMATAVATGEVITGSLLMFSFGLGTIPAMAMLMFSRKFISIPLRQKLHTVTPYFIATISILLILRGLNLGIPHISPKQEKAEVNCCSRK